MRPRLRPGERRRVPAGSRRRRPAKDEGPGLSPSILDALDRAFAGGGDRGWWDHPKLSPRSGAGAEKEGSPPLVGIQAEPAHVLDGSDRCGVRRVAEAMLEMNCPEAIPASGGAPNERVLAVEGAECRFRLGPTENRVAGSGQAGPRESTHHEDRGDPSAAGRDPANDPETAGRRP